MTSSVAATSATAEWWEMTPPGLGFAVEVPGDNTVYKEDNTHPDILAARRDYMVVSDFEAPLYIVSILDFRPEMRAAMGEDAVLAFGMGLMQGCRTTSAVEQPAAKGMMMAVTYACTGDYRVRGRLHLVGNRLWRVTVGGPGDVFDGADATRFLASFRLTEDG